MAIESKPEPFVLKRIDELIATWEEKFQQGYVTNIRNLLLELDFRRDAPLQSIHTLQDRDQSTTILCVSGLSTEDIQIHWSSELNTGSVRLAKESDQACHVSVQVDPGQRRQLVASYYPISPGFGEISISVSNKEHLQVVDFSSVDALSRLDRRVLRLNAILSDDGYAVSQDDLDAIDEAKKVLSVGKKSAIQSDGAELEEQSRSIDPAVLALYSQFEKDWKESVLQLVETLEDRLSVAVDELFTSQCELVPLRLEPANSLSGEGANIDELTLCELVEIAESDSLSPLLTLSEEKKGGEVIEVLQGVRKKDLELTERRAKLAIKEASQTIRRHGYPYLEEKNVPQVLWTVFMKARRQVMFIVIIFGFFGLQNADFFAKGSFVFLLLFLVFLVFEYRHQRQEDHHSRKKRGFESDNIWKMEIAKLKKEVFQIRKNQISEFAIAMNDTCPELRELLEWSEKHGFELRNQFVEKLRRHAETKNQFERPVQRIIDQARLIEERQIEEKARQNTARCIARSVRLQQSQLRRALSGVRRLISQQIRQLARAV